VPGTKSKNYRPPPVNDESMTVKYEQGKKEALEKDSFFIEDILNKLVLSSLWTVVGTIFSLSPYTYARVLKLYKR